MMPRIPADTSLTTPLRRRHFMAQLAHESGGFKRLVENLNYSVEALQRTWPGRFDAATATTYARQPERIANRVYGGRLGNGPEATGDGWRYRGRGYIQLTGKANYAKYSQLVFGDDRLVREPGQAAEPAVAMRLALAYWNAHDLNTLADRDDLEGITRRINGGLIGLTDRRRWLEHFTRNPP